MEEILIPIAVFGTIFGIFYLFLSTRHRERMSLIEKGADASLFYAQGKGNGHWRNLIFLNLALTLMGVGLGITIAIFLYGATGEDAVYPACIFFFAGAGLLASFLIGRKMKED